MDQITDFIIANQVYIELGLTILLLVMSMLRGRAADAIAVTHKTAEKVKNMTDEQKLDHAVEVFFNMPFMSKLTMLKGVAKALIQWVYNKLKKNA